MGVNSHQDSADIAALIAYSTDGISAGPATAYGPYAAKNAGGIGWVSAIVVQNVGSTAATPSLGFISLAGSGGQDQTVTSSVAIAPGAAWAFDPRFAFGTTTPCGGSSSTCLGDGEYSFVAAAAGGSQRSSTSSAPRQRWATPHHHRPPAECSFQTSRAPSAARTVDHAHPPAVGFGHRRDAQVVSLLGRPAGAHPDRGVGSRPRHPGRSA